MSALFPTLAAGAASLAFGCALWQVGSRVLDLEKRREPPAPAEGPASRSPRTSKPMFSGLYREPSPSPVSTLMSIPGGTWLAGALVLGLFATVTTTFNREALPPQVTSADSGMVHLQSRVDSLALVVRQLHDSLILAKTPSVPGKAKPASTRLAGRPAAESKAILPAPPPPLGSPVQ